jgi:hypothetical protein
MMWFRNHITKKDKAAEPDWFGGFVSAGFGFSKDTIFPQPGWQV